MKPYFEAPLRLLWGFCEATLNVLLFKIEWMNQRFGSAWGLLEMGRIPDMCHTSPSVAKFKLCKPEKKNSLLSNTLVPRLTSAISQAGNLSNADADADLLTVGRWYHDDDHDEEDNDYDDVFFEQRFYRYHEHLHHKSVVENQKSVILPTSYWDIFKKCAPQVDWIFLLLHFSYFKKICWKKVVVKLKNISTTEKG